MTTHAPDVAYFGKLPTHGDFVRRHATGAAARTMDAWMQEGLYLAKSRLGNRLGPAYGAAGPFGFVFNPPAEDPGPAAEPPLVGVLLPSRDRVGRAYPFVLAVDGGRGRLEDLPVRCAAFFEHAARAGQAAVAGRLPASELPAYAGQLSGALHSDGRPAFARFLNETRLTAFWASLWGHAEDSRKYVLFKNLLDLLLPLRQGVPEGFPLVLRFPLGGYGPAPSFDVRFWLEVVRCLLGRAEAHPTFVWSLSSARARSYLWVTLRPPPPELFGFLLATDAEGDKLCVLERLGSGSAALAALSIPAHYGRLLEDERLSLAGFLRRL